MPRSHHDTLVKRVFTQQDQAAAWLRGALPARIAHRLDLQTVQLLPGSFVDDDLSEQHTDLLFEVQTHAVGQHALVYVLFEHQSTPDGRMPVRLLACVDRIWRRWLTDHPGARAIPVPGWIEALAEVRNESGLRAVDAVLRYVVEVDADPPGAPERRLLRDRVGPQAEEIVMGWAQTLREETRAEGRQEGRAEGRALTLLQLLQERFGDGSDEICARVLQATSEELTAWTSRVLVAESALEVVQTD